MWMLWLLFFYVFFAPNFSFKLDVIAFGECECGAIYFAELVIGVESEGLQLIFFLF